MTEPTYWWVQLLKPVAGVMSPISESNPMLGNGRISNMPKFKDFDEFYSSLPEDQEVAIRRLVQFVAKQHKNLELVLAWNQPMFKLGKKYIIGFMPTKNHINLLTISDDAVSHFAVELEGYRHGSRSISLPFDWKIDQSLITKIIDFQIRNN